MKISSIIFKNPLDGYDDEIELESLDSINVIIGKNNSGKTRVLKQLFSALSKGRFDGYDGIRDVKRISFELSGIELGILFVRYQEGYLSGGKFSFFTDVLKSFNDEKTKDIIVDMLFTLAFERDGKDLNKRVTLSTNDPIDAKFQEKIDHFNQQINSPDRPRDGLYTLIYRNFKSIFLPSMRKLEPSTIKYGSESYNKARNVLEKILTNGFNESSIEGFNLKKFEEYLIPNFIVILDLIEKNEIPGLDRRFFEDFLTSIEAMFPDIHFNLYDDRMQFKLLGNVQEYERDIGDWKKLGHGTQQLISLLFLLALPGIWFYFIDEPETGLHPGLQTKFLQFIEKEILLKQDQVKQFIFTTHSTSFINLRENCSHYILKKSKDLITAERISKQNTDLIRNELGLKPSDLYQANGVIWVEGPSDVFYLKMLFKCHGYDLDSMDVLFASYGSSGHLTANHYPLSLLERLNPNFLVIIDSDKKSKEDPLKKKLKEKKEEFNNAGHEFWIIEEYKDTEGILPQEVINEFFKVNSELTVEQLKNPYINLDKYVGQLKEKDLISKNRKYDKTRDAPRLSNMILENSSYKQKILSNGYLNKWMERLLRVIRGWTSGNPLGVCIRCGRSMALNPSLPFCKSDFRIWSNFGNIDYQENYCHECGNPSDTSMKFPLCNECFKGWTRKGNEWKKRGSNP